MTEARGLEEAGKYEEAREIYQEMIVANQHRYEPYHRLGVVADRQRKFREAEALFGQAIQRNPANPELFNDLGYCFFLQGRLEKSERALLKAVGLSPSSSRFRNNLGLVYGYQGRDADALDEFRRAGNEAEAYYNLAFVLAGRDDMSGAKDCFRLALAADPTCDRARRALAAFEKHEQDPQGLTDFGPIVENGIRWVPYVEGASSEEEGPQTVSHEVPVSPRRLIPAARPTTQSQLHRARSTISEGMLGYEG
jgi:Flp pilus assembly protein TadD